MIVSPHIFPQVQRQFFPSNSPFGGQFPLQVTPETFQPIDVVSFPVAVLFLSVVHQAVNKSPGGDSRIGSPGIRTDGRTGGDLPGDEGLKGSCFYVVHHLSLDGTVPAQDPEDRLFLRASSPFRSLVPDDFPPVFPLSSEIGLVHFHCPGEDFGYIPDEGSPDEGEGTQNPSPFERGPESDVLATLLQQEPGDDLLPLIPGQVQG